MEWSVEVVVATDAADGFVAVGDEILLFFFVFLAWQNPNSFPWETPETKKGRGEGKRVWGGEDSAWREFRPRPRPRQCRG